ncbi:MAG: F0F1 ATP synthase subunit alpha [Patescibacteria group bacterium]
MDERFQNYLDKIGEIGFVKKLTSSIAYVEGIPGVKLSEQVLFESGMIGQVVAIDEYFSEVLIFSTKETRVGEKVARTNKRVELPVGEELLGKVVDPLGESLDPFKSFGPLSESRPIDAVAPGINARRTITKLCETGVTLTDLLIPIGKGQRELVIGDKKTGKTRFLLRSLLAQVKSGSVGIYTIIGKSKATIKQMEEDIKDLGIFENVVLVAAAADAPAGLSYLAPYYGMTIAEYFRDKGRDVFLILDDLSVHAKVYREMSLLAKKFPGRLAYPGDIFYTHAKLLERAGNFSIHSGEASITCLPVAETVQGDITGYITTNLMSMTDGHIFFDHLLFIEGRRPAVDPFISVTRVGRQTQTKLQREVSQVLLSFLKEADRLKGFMSFGAELGEHILKAINKENQIMILLDQTSHENMPINVQLLLFGLIWGDLWAGLSEQEVRESEFRIIHLYESDLSIRRIIDSVIISVNSIDDLADRISRTPEFKEWIKKAEIKTASLNI